MSALAQLINYQFFDLLLSLQLISHKLQTSSHFTPELFKPIHTQHTVTMPFLCYAVPLKVKMCFSHLIYTVRPCLIQTCHALTMPFFSRPRHSTAVERRPVGYLPAFGFFRLPRGVPRRLLSEAYQSSSQSSIPTTVNSGNSTLQKRRSLKLLD